MENLGLALRARQISQAALGKHLGVTQARVSQWVRGETVPEHYCPLIERLSGLRCEDLRPDVRWQRDGNGRITGYVVPVDGRQAADQARAA